LQVVAVMIFAALRPGFERCLRTLQTATL
jgi:hypothetical protein